MPIISSLIQSLQEEDFNATAKTLKKLLAEHVDVAL
jgi:hypothetical protein